MASLLSGSLAAQEIKVETLHGFPTAEAGIEKGVSACFAGVLDGRLILAGGANFPEVPAAEHGQKRFYRGIYAARLDGSDTLQWALAGELPEPLAYGVSLQLGTALVFIGGQNAKGDVASAYEVTLQNGKAELHRLPDLPKGLSNTAGFVLDGEAYVYDTYNKVYRLTPTGWVEAYAVPGPQRQQPIAAVVDGKPYLWGGFNAKTETGPCRIHADGVSLADGLTVAAPAVEASLSGAACINLSASEVLAVGGVNQTIFETQVNTPRQGYMLHEPEWYHFCPYLMVFRNGQWTKVAENKLAALAGCTLAAGQGGEVYVIGGELKPGIRAPRVLRIRK